MTTDPCWARVGVPLEGYAEGFRVELGRLGYTPLTAAGHVRLMAHLARWLAGEGIDASALTPATVEAYFAQRRAAGYANELTARALRPLLDYLRTLGVVAAPAQAVPATPVDRLLQRYREYLAVERGLAGTTVELNARLVHSFLLQRAQAHHGQLALSLLTADDVRRFVLAQSRLRPRSVKRMVTALRSLLGFLHIEGIIVQPLTAAVPSAAG
jgi:integrase/recombinase XerD